MIDHPIIHAVYNKYKSKCSFITASYDMLSILEVAKVSDILLFVINGDATIENSIDEVCKTLHNIFTNLHSYVHMMI